MTGPRHELDHIGGKLVSIRSATEDPDGAVITRLNPRGERDVLELTGAELGELVCLVAGIASFTKMGLLCD